MSSPRHLVLRELLLPPSAEWAPHGQGWMMLRVAAGTGYWWQRGAVPQPLNAGDGLLILHPPDAVIRVSRLGPLQLQFFFIQPQHLNGLLTVAEWQRLQIAPKSALPPVSRFTAAEPIGQKFNRLAAQRHSDRLPMRCALLQLWAGAIARLLPAAAPGPAAGLKLRDQFRALVGQMTEAELSEGSLTVLARQLHCSERHFSRLFREEFGVPFRTRQIELRLQRARQSLAEGDIKIGNIAYESGYRHLGVFNAMFKKRFGVTPAQWREQHRRAEAPPQTGGGVRHPGLT